MAASLLAPVFFAVLIVWAALGAAVLSVWSVRARHERRLHAALAWLARASSPSPEEAAAALDRTIGALPAGFLIARLAGSSLPGASVRTLSSWLAARSRGQLIGWASRTERRSAARRIEAIHVLVQAGCDEALGLLERALTDGDAQVVSAAISLLGALPRREAAQLLVDALRAARCQPSRIATILDRFPLPIGDLLQPLAADPNPVVRFWGATLLSRYATEQGVRDDVAALVRDADPRVRKAAVETIGNMGGEHAATLALGLLGDPVWYVRAHAARALGDLGRADLAPHVVPLLADRQWWVRQAAKECLEKMGTDVWRDLVKCLDHPDAFARNAAAEVLQNLGILDSLIVIEATTPHPAPDKVEILRKIAAAGGVRMTSALLERADVLLAQRIHALLDSLGLQAAGV